MKTHSLWSIVALLAACSMSIATQAAQSAHADAGTARGNKALVTSWFALMGKRDFVALEKMVAPGAVFTQPQSLPWRGRHIGWAEWNKMFATMTGLFEIKAVNKPQLSINETGNRVIASFSVNYRSKQTGKTDTLALEEVFEIEGGKIYSITPYFFDTKVIADLLKE